MAEIDRLVDLIEPEVQAEGLALVRVKMFGGTSDPTLQIMAERPDTRQLTLDDCARLSRRLSERLDDADPIEHGYRLEVSSPGIDRPLTRLQDFADWAGHEARISLATSIDGRKQFTGELAGVDGDNIFIGARTNSSETFRVPFAAVHSAKLLMTDRLIAATAPLSPEGADTVKVEEGQD